MNSEKQAALQAEKKKKRLRFAGLVILTVLVVAAVIITALSVKSCEERVNLDLGQPYDAGKATVTANDVRIIASPIADKVYVFVRIEISARKDFTFDPADCLLDGDAPINQTSTVDGEEISAVNAKKEVKAGETEEIWLCYIADRSMKVSFLTYKKAVIRLGSLTENDNNLSKE